MPLDPSRTVAELRELRELTGDENGAQRVAWTDTWEWARQWMRGKLDGLGLEHELDEAGNQWWTLRGGSERAMLIGGHIDSVPNGGWLDGCLNVLAGVEVLRRIAEEGTPPVTVRLVDWADEEGARFGRWLFGSSAAAGSMADQDELRQLQDRDGVSLPDALREHGIELDQALEARRQLEGAAAYLELHIEQGPVLESLDLPLGAVLGTFGVERHRITWRGQAAHAGSTPMDQRRDALAGAAKLALEIREIARSVGHGAVMTSGGVVTKPGIVTSVVETAEQLLDMRHLDAPRLAELNRAAHEASERFAQEERLEVEWERIWEIEPILFDAELIEFAHESIQEVAGKNTPPPRDARRDEREPEQPARRDRVLLEADEAEVVDRQRGERLPGQDERDEGRSAQLRRGHDAAEDVERAQAAADPHPPRRPGQPLARRRPAVEEQHRHEQRQRADD